MENKKLWSTRYKQEQVYDKDAKHFKVNNLNIYDTTNKKNCGGKQ